MRAKLFFMLIVLISAAASQTKTCDRACLEHFVDQYMDALIAHDPGRLPMAQHVRNTEDGVPLDPGDGFWRTALGKGSYRLFVTDTEAGQVALSRPITTACDDLKSWNLSDADGAARRVQ